MNSVVLGTQWGDEGKAKIVDYLSSDYDIIVRYQGGANAGHTVVVGDKKTVFHLIPTGILRQKVSVLGSGTVIELEEFFNEISALSKNGIDVSDKLFISSNAHLVLPIHKKIDHLLEERRIKKIGTTLRGIGPAYTDKISRKGILIKYLKNCELLEKKLQENIRANCQLYDLNLEIEFEDNLNYLYRFREKTESFILDSVNFLRLKLEQNKNVLFEGAQGSLLDINNGTYPFVTSSNTNIGNVYLGGDFPFNRIDKSIGIVKAYLTRVGEGPFPTEVKNEVGEYIQEKGAEFGATTGRKRSVGWLDLPALKFSSHLNNLTELVLTKIDVLSGLKELKIAVGYDIDGKKYDYLPADADLYRVKPIYKIFHGWNKDVSECRDYSELPDNTKKYIEFIESELGRKITLISNGCRRDQMIVR